MTSPQLPYSSGTKSSSAQRLPLRRLFALTIAGLIYPAFADAQSVQNALHFDGADDHVTTGLPSLFQNIAANDFTFEAWVNPETTIFTRIVYAQNDGANFASLGTGNGRVVYFYVVANGITHSVATTTSMPANQWTHLAARWSASTEQVQVLFDGVLQPTIAGGSSSTGTSGVMAIGSRPGGAQYYMGGLDEVRVWASARTEAQIQANKNIRIPSPQPGLVAYYDFNHGTPGGNNAGVTALNDYSGNALGGTLLNFALNGPTSNWIAGPALGVGSLGLTAIDDAVTTTGSAATVYPLANDSTVNGGQLSVISVSDPAVSIAGRALIVPHGTPSFTYTVGDGTAIASAEVEVITGSVPVNPSGYLGLLRNDSGEIVGSARVNISPRGYASVQLRVGKVASSGRFTFAPESTTAEGDTTLGAFAFTRNVDGTIDLALQGEGSVSTGSLRSIRSSTAVQKLHVALNSVDAAFPGGGFAVANVKSSGLASLAGTLPDGRPFTATSSLSENGTIAFFAVQSMRVNPAGFIGGEFVMADLDATDVTGELTWTKPAQDAGVKGIYLAGVNTVLAANGSLYEGIIPISGPADLVLTGGNLVATEENTVNVNAGVPAVPTGSLVSWGVLKSSVGKFRAKVKVPGFPKAVTGSGIYLPKSQSAWGHFSGSALGGSIELRAAPVFE